MAKTDHRRPARKNQRSFYDEQSFGKRQPRPALRKQSTRKGAVAAARREAGL